MGGNNGGKGNDKFGGDEVGGKGNKGDDDPIGDIGGG